MSKEVELKQFEPQHNHRSCLNRAISLAAQICAQKGLRFTPIRRRVLELIWNSHQPVPAYDLLSQLRQEKQNAEPPTIYRALDFLLEHQLIHRIESLNAYIGCDHPDLEHSSQFMICSACHQVAELAEPDLIDQAVACQASRLGFKISSQTIEIMGICPSCQN